MSYTYVYLDPRKSPPEPFYIGKGSGNRKNDHLNEAKTNNSGNHPKFAKIHKIWAANLNPIVEVLDDGINDDDAFELETFLVAEIGSKYVDGIKNGPLCNMTKGGNGGGCKYIWDDSKRLKHSARMLGINTGNKNGMFGKKGYWLGKKMPESTRLQNGKHICQFSLDGIFIKELPIMNDVCKEFNISCPTLRKAARGNGKFIARGFRWSFNRDSKLNDIIPIMTGKNPNSHLTGLKNGKTNIIHIYNQKSELMFVSDTSFPKFCKKHKLPYNSFTASYTGGTKIFQDNAAKGRANKNGYFQYIGWFAQRQ